MSVNQAGVYAPNKEVKSDLKVVSKGDAAKTDSPSKLPLSKIVDRIGEVETNSGKNLNGLHGKCVLRGLDNTYSYSPGTCYKDEQETRNIVTNWLEQKTKEMPIKDALNLYGCGKKQCDYADKIINHI